jgi:hypothetical protein
VKRCPSTAEVKNISGSFVVTMPLMQDERTEDDVNWYKELAFSEAIQFGPAGFGLENLQRQQVSMPGPPHF